MPNINGDVRTAQTASPPVQLKVNRFHGRVRFAEFQATNPAAGGVAIGEDIVFGRLPRGARVIPHLSRLDWSAGAASSTVAIGDPASTARYLAATSVTSAGGALLASPANGAASYETVNDTEGSAADDTLIRGRCAGAAIAANQVFCLRIAYTMD
ncbi:MAG: hypothetical protein MUC68_06980 [Burkholderiaceae bacterium]|jgi:hypothetical protein|nr:hypothetical protein [Burkholderiaceae bacterium]